jgi:hypothetical protein
LIWGPLVPKFDSAIAVRSDFACWWFRFNHPLSKVQWWFENRPLVKACWWVKGTLMVQVFLLIWLHLWIRATLKMKSQIKRYIWFMSQFFIFWFHEWWLCYWNFFFIIIVWVSTLWDIGQSNTIFSRTFKRNWYALCRDHEAEI